MSTGLIKQHKQRARLTTEVGRYSTLMVARTLGVPDTRVRLWITHGWLKARKRTSGGIHYWVIDAHAISQFLRSWGAMQRCINPPDPLWQATVERERALFFRHHTSACEIAKMLNLVPAYISNGLKKEFDFPVPAYTFHTQGGGDFFDNYAIIEWLRAHPKYDPEGRVRRYLAHITNEV